MTTGATAAVKGGFWEQNGVASLASISGKGANRRAIAQAFDGKGLFASREVLRTLDGAVAGTTATKTYSRVEANVELGGKRIVESTNLVNRATTAGDVTETKADFLSLSARTTLASPANKDGNPLGTR